MNEHACSHVYKQAFSWLHMHVRKHTNAYYTAMPFKQPW